jgi:hypothetical protein
MTQPRAAVDHTALDGEALLLVATVSQAHAHAGP